MDSIEQIEIRKSNINRIMDEMARLRGEENVEQPEEDLNLYENRYAFVAYEVTQHLPDDIFICDDIDTLVNMAYDTFWMNDCEIIDLDSNEVMVSINHKEKERVCL